MLVECFYCIMISAGFCVIYQMRGMDVFWGALGSGMGWAVYLLFMNLADSMIISYCLATIVATIYAEIMAVLRRKPSTIFLIPSIIPFVPGGIVFRSMSAWLDGRQNDFLTQGRYAITVAAALAMGIIIGISIMRLQRNIKRYLKEKRLYEKKTSV